MNKTYVYAFRGEIPNSEETEIVQKVRARNCSYFCKTVLPCISEYFLANQQPAASK